MSGKAAERQRQRNTTQERLRALGSGDRSEIGESRAMPRRKQQAPKRAAGKEKPSTYTASVSAPSTPTPHLYYYLGSPLLFRAGSLFIYPPLPLPFPS